MEKATFPGFSKRMPAFFRGLAKNNDRDWFAANKKGFDEFVHGPMVELVSLINSDLKGFAVDHCVGEPKKALYRIYRDTRFAKDKTPYKDHIGATFHRQGLPRNGAAGLYFGVSDKSVDVAGGVYLSDPADFVAIRRAIVAKPKEFAGLVKDKKVTRVMGAMIGEKLTRLPKGFEEQGDSVAAEYLRHKQLYWHVELPAKVALGEGLRKEIVGRFRVMMPTLNWMNQVLLAVRAEGEEERPIRPEPMF